MTIKDLRLEKGMTLANFAKAIGIGMSTLTSYEAGKRKPGEKALAAIKEVFGVDLNEAAAAVESVVENAVKTVEAAVAPAEPADPAPADPTPAPAPAPVKEKKAAAKKPAAKKELKAPAKKEKAAKSAPAKKEKAAPAKKETKAPAKKATAAKKVEMIIQSPMGGEITPEEIMNRIGDVDKVYIRIDQNAAYWVKGEESGAINLW